MFKESVTSSNSAFQVVKAMTKVGDLPTAVTNSKVSFSGAVVVTQLA